MILWLFGKSASGKTTLGRALSEHLCWPLFDGDEMRKTLNADLGFSPAHRHLNALRIALRAVQEPNAIVSVITPMAKSRAMLHDLLEDRVIRIELKCPDEVLRERDPKGLYKAETAGIDLFEATDGDYELSVDTHEMSIDECTNYILTEVTKYDCLERTTASN